MHVVCALSVYSGTPISSFFLFDAALWNACLYACLVDMETEMENGPERKRPFPT